MVLVVVVLVVVVSRCFIVDGPTVWPTDAIITDADSAPTHSQLFKPTASTA